MDPHFFGKTFKNKRNHLKRLKKQMRAKATTKCTSSDQIFFTDFKHGR